MIFQTELTTLDSQINQLLAQVEAARQKQAQLSELDALTDNSLTQLRDVVSKVKHNVPGAIASLKSAVLTLFDSGNHGQDDDGNQPIDPTPNTDPTPEADDDEPELLCLNGETGDYLLSDGSNSVDDAVPCRSCGADLNDETNYPEFVNAALAGICRSCEARVIEAEKKPHPHVTELNGQAYEWATPFASPLCSLLWEDAPSLGQHCIVTFEHNENKGTSEGETMPYVEFVEVSDKVGYIKVCHSGQIKATYAGFSRKDRAEAWGRLLAVTYDIASGFEVRPAKHLPFKWELKLWDMKMAQIQKLAAEDLTKSPRVEVNSAKPPAREPIILDADRVVVGQRIKTKDGQTLEISSTLSADNRFFAKNANEQRQLIELDNVAEFLPIESPAQTAGIAVGSSIRVLSWQGHNCNQSSDIATVLNIEDGMYQIDVKNSQGINIWLSQKAITPLSAEADQTPAQQLGIEPPTGWRQVQSQAESAPTATPTKKARITLESSPWKGQDCEVLEVTADNRWWKLRLPNGQELKYPSDTIEPVVEATDPIGFNDLVEVVADGNDCVGLVGAFGRVKIIGETRIGVEIDEQLVYFNPSELKVKAKEEKAPKRPSLQSGQLLMGDHIVTSGKYIGQARASRLLCAQLGTADKIATIQLAKELKNLGFDPQLAVTVMAGGELDDASDF